ncbi:MAG: (d)CMP kinase [Oscillospiraceae bacterium]|nr:(d)CMP kinase [Oscillospiraceae bacterium]
MSIQIAIDGPVGAGKSTIAREAAKRLGFVYMDTGALYRAIAVYCKLADIDSYDEKSVVSILPKVNLDFKIAGGEQLVYVNNRDVTGRLREPEISMAASRISSYGAVRAFLLDLQRDFAAKNNVIMDGRDIGTVVLPDATLKIFLWADPHERAMRRYEELIQKGLSTEFSDVLSDLVKRDAADTNRKHAPLKQAEDAVRMDTTGNTLEQSIEWVIDTIKLNIEGL